MLNKSIRTALIYCLLILLPAISLAQEITISNPKISMTLNYSKQACITSLVVNGQKVISGTDGIFSSVDAGGKTYSSLHLKRNPVLVRNGSIIKLNDIEYGNNGLKIKENWLFTINNKSIKWAIKRSTGKSITAEESGAPVFNFDNINTWEGAYQGYGGGAPQHCGCGFTASRAVSHKIPLATFVCS